MVAAHLQENSPFGPIPTAIANLRYQDMNVGNGGVARDTSIGSTFVDVFNQTGTGVIFGFLLTLELAFDEWVISLEIDGNEVFGAAGINTKDLAEANIYGYDLGGNEFAPHLGFALRGNTIYWAAPFGVPISYSTDIVLKARYVKGGTKRFRAGLMLRTL